MDLWVVAAATGAGYIAKYWKNLLSKEGEASSQSLSFYSIHRQSDSSNLLKQIWDQSTPLQRLALKQLARDGFFVDEKNPAVATSDSDSHENYNLLSSTGFPLGVYENESSQRIGNGIEGKIKYFSDTSRPLRSRYCGNFLEPLDSLESCLEDQLCREFVTMEEYAYSLLPSPAVRPLLLTDGNWIISRASLDFKGDFQLESREYKPQNQVGYEENERQLSTRKLKKGIRKRSRFSMMRDSGFANGEVPFVLGISIGLMFTILANKREVQNLNKLLKETQSLVQDLHEELEMKEQRNVKEVADDSCKSRRINELPLLTETPNALNHEQDFGKPTKFGLEELGHHNAERSEAMSKIEAELEAELERLELNIRASSLQWIPPCVELDPDFVPDVVQGDLKLDKATGQPCGFSDSDQDVSETSTNHPDDAGNYAVSPTKLSLRLHELIESRLEARIMELEAALENNQNKLNTLEMESTVPWRGLYSEAEPSSLESSTFIDEGYDNSDSWL